jgi:hypothetical protein
MGLGAARLAEARSQNRETARILNSFLRQSSEKQTILRLQAEI